MTFQMVEALWGSKINLAYISEIDSTKYSEKRKSVERRH